jgi:pyruvate formate lyase activating enzyme
MTVDDVMEEIMRDRTFYETSDGGVTLSGGEPLLQQEFALELLRRCHAEGLHTAVETSTHCRWEDLAELLPVTDLFMVDIKHMDEKKHRETTGVSNQLILTNIGHLVKTAIPIVFRTPVIPGINDSPEDISAIASFVQELIKLRATEGENPDAAISLELLAFHRLARDKYHNLGMSYRVDMLEPSSEEHMILLRKLAKSYGIPVRS